MGAYVGIDLHRRRSVIVVLNDDGDRVSWCRIDNTPANLAAEVVAAGADAEVAMEATWGWYWAADVIAECGARFHLAHPGDRWLCEPAGEERHAGCHAARRSAAALTVGPDDTVDRGRGLNRHRLPC